MKKFLLSAFALVMGIGMMQAQSKTYTALVYVNNPTATTTAYQCDVVLPSGVTAVADSEKSVTKTGCCDASFKIAGNTVDGAHRLVNYSENNKNIAKTGCVASFDVDVVGTATLKFSVKAGSSEIVNSACEVENTPTITIRIKGDVNGDGKLSALDIAQYKKAAKGTANIYADANTDGKISALDLAQIKKYIKL